MLKHKTANIILLIIGIFLLGGCRAKKLITQDENPIINDRQIEFGEMLINKRHRFHTMKIRKVEAYFTMNGINEKARGSIAVYRDSMIAVSIVPILGYEVLRILCTKDSVIIINRIDKTYSARSFEYFRKKYHIPVNFFDLQAIISNEVFYYKGNYDDRVFKQQIDIKDGSCLYIIDAIRDQERISSQGIEIGSDGKSLKNIFVLDYEQRMKLNLDYLDFYESDVDLFPTSLAIDIIENSNNIQLKLKYGQVIFNDSINIEFDVPTQYTRDDM